MRQIELPVSRWEGLGGPAMVVLLALLAAVSPVPPVWRVIEVLAVLALGGWEYLGYRARRPVTALLPLSGAPVFRLPDGSQFCVSTARIGSATPMLLAARCRNARGEVLDLFIPATIVSPDEHRCLRRAVLGCGQARQDNPDRSQRSGPR
ncbi:MAG: hypothetical protein PVF93_07860 [Chromatiaceae bacterium]